MIKMVVVRYCGGVVLKGKTGDFSPSKTVFHLQEQNGVEIKQINIKDLKAVYFVKSFEGNPKYTEKDDVERVGFGRKIKILFKDGEVQQGYTQGYTPNRAGFFVSPCDPGSNNERIFVITEATENVQFI